MLMLLLFITGCSSINDVPYGSDIPYDITETTTTSTTTTMQPTTTTTTTTRITTTRPNSVMRTTADLDNLFRSWGNNISVFYYCINTGFTYRYNANRVYFGASISKAPLALLLYQMADRGEINLDATMRFEARHRNTGSGIINRNYPLGTSFTIRRLIALNLYRSDNVATLMLREFLGDGDPYLGVERYRQFVTSLGANPNHVGIRIMNSQLTVNDAGVFARAIHSYIQSENPHSREFQRHLRNNHFPFLFREVDVDTGSKTGWTAVDRYGTFQGVWHDMSFVYGDIPFILVVMTSGRAGSQGGSARDREDFTNISKAFLEFHRNRS